MLKSLKAEKNWYEKIFLFLQEKDKLEGVVNKLRKSVEKLRQELRSIQDESMNALQEQLVNDKSSSQLNKQLRELREKNRKQEFNMLETENKISKKLLEVEELKAMMSQNQDTTKEFNKELDLKEEELKRYEDVRHFFFNTIFFKKSALSF